MATSNYYALMGEILGERSIGGVTLDYLPDALGSVIAASDGTTTSSSTYTPYGRGTAPDGAAFGWVGGFGYRPGFDPASHYVRTRHHSNAQARWLSPDQVGHGQGRYTYALASPITLFDADGRAARPVTGLGGTCCCCIGDITLDNASIKYYRNDDMTPPPDLFANTVVPEYLGATFEVSVTWDMQGAGSIVAPCTLEKSEWNTAGGNTTYVSVDTIPDGHGGTQPGGDFQQWNGKRCAAKDHCEPPHSCRIWDDPGFPCGPKVLPYLQRQDIEMGVCMKFTFTSTCFLCPLTPPPPYLGNTIAVSPSKDYYVKFTLKIDSAFATAPNGMDKQYVHPHVEPSDKNCDPTVIP